MRKSRKGGLRPAFALASLSLFLCVFPRAAAAQGQTASREPGILKKEAGAQDPQTLKFGLGLFFPLSGQELESLDPGEISLDTLSTLARESGEGGLSATLPGILSNRLEPLGLYLGKPSASSEDSGAKLELAVKAKDERFFDPRTDLNAIRGLEGYAAGLYSQSSGGLELLLLYYAKGSAEPAAYHREASTIGELERLGEIFPARIVSWISGRNLSIYDLETGAFGDLRIVGPAGEGSSYFIQGSRIFILEAGKWSFSVAADGYESLVIEIESPGPFAYARIQAPLKKISGLEPGKDFRESSKALEWKDEEAFKKAKARFGSALGRFLVSLPASALSVGNFASVQEAYLRYAKPETSYYASGALAGISIALSLGFTVDTIVALVDLLRLSR